MYQKTTRQVYEQRRGSYQLSHVYDKADRRSSDILRRTEVNHVIPKKATAVAETSIILSYSKLFFDELCVLIYECIQRLLLS